MSIQDIQELVTNEAKGYSRIQQLRADFSPSLFNRVKNMTGAQAIERGLEGVQTVLRAYSDMGIDTQHISPGHGPGHIARDYANGYVLLNRADIDPSHAFVGLVSGSLHDLGCSLVDRYSETTKAIRHAEAGSLLFLDTKTDFFNEAEKNLIAWAIAAHTHYQKTDSVKCSDKITRTVEPYQDLDDSGNPLLGIWLARWIDRLDCNGPTFPARHYLTVGEPHLDFSGDSHFPVEYSDHMTPIIRTPEQIKSAGGKRTMLNHLQSFVDSQSNSSAYGKYDISEYAELRDHYKSRLQRIINSVTNPKKFPQVKQEDILIVWDYFLKGNIEPSKLTRKNLKVLGEKFNQLDDETKNAWVSGFYTTMEQYDAWSCYMNTWLENLKPQHNVLPGISNNLRRDIIAPIFSLPL